MPMMSMKTETAAPVGRLSSVNGFILVDFRHLLLAGFADAPEFLTSAYPLERTA
jgi:hypothetical protein